MSQTKIIGTNLCETFLRTLAQFPMMLTLVGSVLVTAFGAPRVAQAAVYEPSEGTLGLVLYEDSKIESAMLITEVTGTGTYTISSFNSAMNDKASSWSLCNETGNTVYVTLKLYTNSYFGGTLVQPVTNTEIQDGTCVVGAHISPNDSISSLKFTVSN